MAVYILLTGKIARGEIEWCLAPLRAVEEMLPIEEQGSAPDGLLQAVIDYGEETAEYEDYLADIEF